MWKKKFKNVFFLVLHLFWKTSGSSLPDKHTRHAQSCTLSIVHRLYVIALIHNQTIIFSTYQYVWQLFCNLVTYTNSRVCVRAFIVIHTRMNTNPTRTRTHTRTHIPATRPLIQKILMCVTIMKWRLLWKKESRAGRYFKLPYCVSKVIRHLSHRHRHTHA